MKRINIINIAIYLLIGILLFQDTIQIITGFEPITYIDEVLIVIMFIVSIINIIKNRKLIKFSMKLILGIIVFSCIGIISCYINSVFELKNVILSNFLSVKFFIMILAIINMQVNEKIKDGIVNAITFYGKLVIVFAIFNILFPKVYDLLGIGFISYRFNIIAVCSLFNHAGKYGWFMLFVAIYYFSNYKETHQKKDLIWTIVYIIFALFSLRTKVIISVVCLALYEMFIRIKNKKMDLKKIAIACCLLLMLLFIFKDILINTYTLYFTTENGTSARMALNNNSIKILKEYFPLGVGFGKFGSWYARIYYSEYYFKYNMTEIYGLEPENAKFGTDVFWPSIIGETGTLGLIVYIYLLYNIYKILRESYEKQNDVKTKIFLNFAILSFIQTLCESTGEPSFNSAPQNIFLAIIIGLALCRRKE